MHDTEKLALHYVLNQELDLAKHLVRQLGTAELEHLSNTLDELAQIADTEMIARAGRRTG
jgi:hypothetical protein